MNYIEFEIPYTPEIGKNQMKGFGRGYHYTKPSYKNAVASLTELVRGYSGNIKWKKDKVWVEIFLQKPRLVCDVANLIDGIYDAVKVGIGIDDCYFSGKQDWEYGKGVNPYIFISIRQEL